MHSDWLDYHAILKCWGAHHFLVYSSLKNYVINIVMQVQKSQHIFLWTEFSWWFMWAVHSNVRCLWVLELGVHKGRAMLANAVSPTVNPKEYQCNRSPGKCLASLEKPGQVRLTGLQAKVSGLGQGNLGISLESPAMIFRPGFQLSQPGQSLVNKAEDLRPGLPGYLGRAKAWKAQQHILAQGYTTW